MMQVTQVVKDDQEAVLGLFDGAQMEALSSSNKDAYCVMRRMMPPGVSVPLHSHDEWFSRCYSALQYIAHRILGDSLIAERAVRNCWFMASRNPPQFESEGAFRSWMLRLLISEALSILHQDNIEMSEKDTYDLRKK